MKVALLLGEARLYAAHGNPGQDWRLNTDRYSGFMRRPTGRLSSRERADIERVRGRHGLEEGVPVRIFPRRVDALLLGGLGQAVGVDYAKRESIRARYRMSGGRVWVEDIRADGRPVAGRIDLGPAAGRSCRGART